MNRTYEVNKQEKTVGSDKVKNMVIVAVFIALTFVFTSINVQLPLGGKGGLVHLGNIPVFIGAIIYGKKTGAIAGGIGMAAFDLFSGWTLWAPFTLVTVSLMGYVTGAIAEKRPSTIMNIVGMLAALVIKIVGYYIAEAIIYENWITPLLSIFGNVLQVGTAIVVVAIVAPQLKKAANSIR